MNVMVRIWTIWTTLCGKVKTVSVKLATAVAMDNTGEVNIVAMVLLILVVIALVAIFRKEMVAIVTKMFGKIRSQMQV